MSDAQLYARIHERFGFEIPAVYRQMRDRGWMTLKGLAHVLDFLSGNGYLWMNDMEWHPLKDIADFRFGDYCEPYLPGLVPFAFTGGGDQWCWQADVRPSEARVFYSVSATPVMRQSTLRVLRRRY